MSARDRALLSLDRLALPDWPQSSLASSRPLKLTDPRDIDLSARIEDATIKNLLQINYLMEHFANRPLAKIDPRIRKILGIALAQLLFLDRIPPSAAVDEAVKQARRFGRTSASGFVNAVLRRGTREALPPLPSADEDPREHARLALSHPPELFDRLANLLGIPEALRFCQHNNRRPPTILRVAPGVSPDALSANDITITPHEKPGMVVIHPTPHDLLREWSHQGVAQAQDPTAASVADFCDIEPGLRILDRCCGLGTKTIQLRERLGEGGSIVAIDPDPHRIERLQALIAARKLSNVHVVRGAHLDDAREFIPTTGFDRILIDVPCSNSGVLARRSAARYFQSESTLQSLQALQTEILEDTLPAIAPRGLLIYSTCSIWPDENQQMVQSFLRAHPDLTLLREASTLPSFDTDNPTRYHDGGYVAVLQRS